jgi:formylglycine-generating enzyme required for sulfatase activity
MVLIPAGEFLMGSNDTGPQKDNYLAYPEHKVDLKAYWIDKYEVTNLQFLDFTTQKKYSSKDGAKWRLFFTPDTAMAPVVSISWNDAEAFCKSQGKRLPTEEEWEKAARGTDGRRYPWGNEWIDNKANTHETGNSKPVNIGQFEDASPFGVHDTLGNVQEWTGSYFNAYKGNPKPNEKMGTKIRVLRGLATNYYREERPYMGTIRMAGGVHL